MLVEEAGKENGTELRLPTVMPIYYEVVRKSVPVRDEFNAAKAFLEKGPLKSSSSIRDAIYSGLMVSWLKK